MHCSTHQPEYNLISYDGENAYISFLLYCTSLIAITAASSQPFPPAYQEAGEFSIRLQFILAPHHCK